MNSLDALPPLREVVKAYDLTPRKALGQNFLFDLNLTARIARAAGPLEGVTVVEVGPGPGGLTRALLAQNAAHVIAIERDTRCLDALQEISQAVPGRLTLIEADALNTDFASLLPASARVRLVANLPYNIGTALLTRWLAGDTWPPFWESATLMFQREVAERIVATPLERKAYGRLGVLCGWRTQARILFDVSPSAFTPPPKVVSSVVQLIPRPGPQSCRVQTLETLTQAAFGQRRKMLRQSLKGLVNNPEAFLTPLNIPSTARAEERSVDDFIRMARALDGTA